MPVVLIVEDDSDLLVLAESNVADFGYSTLSASNGREALVLLAEAASVAVLFTDINLPDVPDGIDGVELARRAVELRPGLRVIYTSGSPPTDGMIALFVEGSAFLRKPYTREALMQAIRSHCEPSAEPTAP